MGMTGMICRDVMRQYTKRVEKLQLEGIEGTSSGSDTVKNSDEVLKEAASIAEEQRKEQGLSGLVKGLQAVIINTQKKNQIPAAGELMDFTGLRLDGAFENDAYSDIMLKVEGSADFIIRHRRKSENPFKPYNAGPRSAHLPDTRLETFVFETPDIERYVDIQRARGVRFLTDIQHTDNYSFIQTIPSSFTGNSIGFIEWKGPSGRYMLPDDNEIDIDLGKKDSDYLKKIRYLDHAATRLESQNRDAAIIEFMELTNYHFDFAIYVDSLNSITNVARLSKDDYAQVFTTGISPFKSLEVSGPTEKFVHNFGPRVHHMAFQTEQIDDVYEGLVQDGMEFLVELIGSPEEGLKQTFTVHSPYTLLVNEYIHRYGDFDGFFTRSNVTELTRATGKQ